MPVSRATPVANDALQSGYVGFDSDLHALWPTVHDWLTMVVDDRGVKRQTSSLSVFMDDGTFKAVLNDKDASRSLFVSGRTLWAALDSLEAHLVAGTGEWRKSQWKGAKR